jgi:hypothetical protein
VQVLYSKFPKVSFERPLEPEGSSPHLCAYRVRLNIVLQCIADPYKSTKGWVGRRGSGIKNSVSHSRNDTAEEPALDGFGRRNLVVDGVDYSFGSPSERFPLSAQHTPLHEGDDEADDS